RRRADRRAEPEVRRQALGARGRAGAGQDPPSARARRRLRALAAHQLQRGEHLARRAGAFLRAALHVPLEVLRAVLAGEVDVPLLYALIAREAEVLPRLVVRVRAAEQRVAVRRR